MALEGGLKASYSKISKNSKIGDLLTSGDLTINLIGIVNLPSERASKYQHLKWSYDSLSSKSTNLGSVFIFGGVKTYF